VRLPGVFVLDVVGAFLQHTTGSASRCK
jgi:hypothetical protein